MPKGLHTAGAVVLFRAAPRLDALARALASFPGGHVLPAEGAPGWMGENGFVSLPAPPRGRLVVTPFADRWPDDLGNPQTDPMLFGAWTLGFFGPGAWPGGLARAVGHSYGWPEARRAVETHAGFVRLLISQAGGEDDPVIPEGYDPIEELRALTAVAQVIAGMDGALAFFDPSGETLVEPGEISEAVARNALPLDLWSNVRMFGAGPGWTVMDTVGLIQLDRDDLEIAFADGLDPNDVANFLRSVSDYLVEHGPVIRDGHTVEGPGGGGWQAWSGESLTEPPRRVLRFLPVDLEVPEALRAGLAPPDEPDQN